VEQQEEADVGEEDNVSKKDIRETVKVLGKLSKQIKANMFLDSGATESNYVRQDVVSTLLKAHRQKHSLLQPQPTNVCGAFGQCQLSSHCIKIYVTMPARLCMIQCNNIKNENDHKQQARIVPLLFRILRNLPYDMIIGRPDIVRYDLWYLLSIRHNEETIQNINIHPPILATALESTIAIYMGLA
jgi:hypothetical protein